MAYYAALVSLVQLLEDIVHSDQYLLLYMQQQIAFVYEKFSCLQELLDDYSPKDREEADFLERRIRDAAYQAQDIIESHITETYREFQPKLGIRKKYQDLEKVKEQINSIVEKLLTIKKRQTTEDLQLNYYPTDAGMSKQAPSCTSDLEGVEERLMVIKDQLYGEPSKRQIISIEGMGGIGKTTLAENIFRDMHKMHHFDCSAWVTVSQNYHFKKVLLHILDSMNVPTDKSSEVAQLGVEIYKHLNERRYLIVIDDVWDTKVWDDINSILPDDSNGSRIMITTRILDVASYVGSSDFYHHMQTLNEDQSWNLFCKKVFCPPELEDIGRLIAKNCSGLPLAIVVVAGFLSKVNKKRSIWEEIARNISSTAAEDDEQLSKVLSLSYYHLPHHLKPLFLYIGGFPEDYEIPVSRLIKLWIAEGFLKPIQSKSFEELAKEYLDDLVKRNLVLITKKTFTDNIKRCGIHDVLRELCTKIVCYENFFHVLHKDFSICPIAREDVRRVYIHPAQSTYANAQKCGSLVRTIIHHSHDQFLSFGLGFKLLRVLDAVRAILFPFPTEILELFHLRYLALSNHALPIPPSISKLENLQTLILVSLNDYGKSFLLPSEIWDMPNLRHIMVCQLELSFYNHRFSREPFIVATLQTLSWVVNVRFTIEVIQIIPNLEKLKVLYYETSRVWQDFHLKNLFQLRQLKTLNICFIDHWHSSLVQSFPESFAFPLTLNKLSLKGCRIPLKDMTTVGSLPNLQVLKLRDYSFVGEKWESVEGEFTQLRFLLMQNLGIKYWQAERSHFPRLQRLKIISCWDLLEIPHEIGEISTLELVEVYFSKLAAKSAMEILNEQWEMANYTLQVRVYPQHRDFSEEENSESEEEIQEKASENEEEILEEASKSDKEIQEEASESEEEILEETSESNKEIQEEASEGEEEIQEETLESKEKIQEEASKRERVKEEMILESNEEVQERTPANKFKRWKCKLSLWKRFQNAWRSSKRQPL